MLKFLMPYSLSVSVFLFMSLWPRHDAFGTLYAIPLIIISSYSNIRTIWINCGIFSMLDLASFFWRHHDDTNVDPYLRLILSIVGIIVTTALLVKNKSAASAISEQINIISHANRMTTLGHFSISILHELNQPLATIANYSHSALRWTKKNPPNIPETQHCIKNIVYNINRSSEIINNLHNLTQKNNTDPEAINIMLLLYDIQKFVKNELEMASSSISINSECKEFIVYAKKIEIQQVIINIVINSIQSIKISKNQKREILITISSATRSNFVEITIKDTGIGFKENDPEVLFEPFVTTKENGMGLGLTICRNIIKSYGGSISACNIKPSGAQVSVLLPTMVRK